MDSSDELIRSRLESHRHALHERIAELQVSQRRLQQTLDEIQGTASQTAGLANRLEKRWGRGLPTDAIPANGQLPITALGSADGLLPRLFDVQEQERRRIARELHDELGQSLAALLMGLKSAEQACHDAQLATQLRQLQQLTDEMCLAIRELTLRLRPAALDEVGLQEALTQQIEVWSERTGIQTDFHFGPVIAMRLGKEIEATVYRVVQEALTNVLKHAQAKRVSIVVTERNGQLHVIVEDDGRGCDAQRRPSGGGLGLLGMRERLSSLHGHLEIESSPGGGTTLFARIPLSSAKEDQS
jgi:signal transduction histidine kinase